MTRRIAGVLLGAALAAGAAQAQPIGTAFTYQARLTDAGNPASGTYDLQLALFDASSGGAQVGSTLSRDDVVVANGLFTVSLDFGAVFTGSKRWLELRVRPGASTGAYTTLGGRQELTPSPNAAFSSTAPWSGVSGKPAGFADDIDNDALGALSCPNGQIAKRVAGAWACADDADSGGDITGVTAGTGLTGGGTSGAVTLGANLAGSGSASTIARSDHDHFSQSWSGVGVNGLTVTNSSGTALRGLATTSIGVAPGVWGSSQASIGIGVFGQALATTGATRGVWGDAASSSGTGVYGTNTAPGGVGLTGSSTSTSGSFGIGVYGSTLGQDNSYGVRGSANSSSGFAFGVVGDTQSPIGRGVWGTAFPLTGLGVGVWGTGRSPDGLGGYFENVSGGAPALGVDEGGIRFGDMTVQTTAATGDVTEVKAGAGLTGGGTSGALTLGVNFGGVGSSSSVSRADHNHLSQVWSGNSLVAFQVVNTVESVGGFRDGIFGQANSGNSSARGVVGYAPGGPGVNYGVWGQADSGQGRGVYGLASAASGVNYGVYGQTNSASGYAGYFEGNVAIPGTGKLGFGLTARQVIDLNSASYGIGVQGGVVYFRTEPPGGMFSWFMGGSHSNTQNDPGPGGVRNMRLDGAGNLFVRGSVFPGGADFAEMLPAEPGLEPGDVLAIGEDGALTLSTQPYQDALAGVYSTKPGLVGGAADGESTEGKVPLAVTGVVPVKATDEGGPIRPGDSLTSSSTPGHAMRAARDRIVVGVVIGKALEPMCDASGVVRALVVLQ